ncbi:MAG: hypothetical protein J6M12_00630 [Clostridia bacterium]|nr:hypothetical protein [Clostridia bacterium]
MKNPLKLFSFKKKEKGLTASAGSAVGVHAEPISRPGRQYKSQKVSKPDAYYVKLSGVSRFWRYVVTFALLIFAVGMTFLFSDEITAENFGLLLRNVSFSFPGENVAFTTVRYDADLAMDFAAYKEYFAVSTTTGLRLYDHRGHIALDEELKMSDPTLDSGEKYILVYDKEGYEYKVCNSISLLFSGKEEGAIHYADLCDEGSFLMVTGSSAYRSVIKVYNRSFNLQRELTVDRYPLSANLSPNGKMLLFLSCTTGEDGSIKGYVNLYDLKEKTELLLEQDYDRIPLYGVPTDEGAAVVFSDGVRFYDKEGRERSFFSFDGKSLYRHAASDRMLGLAFEENNVAGEYTVMALDLQGGELLFEGSHRGRIRDLFVCGKTVFVSDDGNTVSIDCESGEQTVHKGEQPLNIVCSEDGTVFACYGNKSENIGKVNIENGDGETEHQDRENEEMPSPSVNRE